LNDVRSNGLQHHGRNPSNGHGFLSYPGDHGAMRRKLA
jgi:hypothetical protein